MKSQAFNRLNGLLKIRSCRHFVKAGFQSLYGDFQFLLFCRVRFHKFKNEDTKKVPAIHRDFSEFSVIVYINNIPLLAQIPEGPENSSSKTKKMR